MQVAQEDGVEASLRSLVKRPFTNLHVSFPMVIPRPQHAYKHVKR